MGTKRTPFGQLGPNWWTDLPGTYIFAVFWISTWKSLKKIRCYFSTIPWRIRMWMVDWCSQNWGIYIYIYVDGKCGSINIRHTYGSVMGSCDWTCAERRSVLSVKHGMKPSRFLMLCGENAPMYRWGNAMFTRRLQEFPVFDDTRAPGQFLVVLLKCLGLPTDDL